MRRTTAALASLVLAASMGLAACSDDNEEPAPVETTASASAECAEDAAAAEATEGFGEAPEITIPEGAPPCELVIEDLVVGEGAEVADIATPYLWNYEGVAWSTGEVFDSSFESSFERGEPTAFALNQVIAGWTEGLVDMKVGGRRLLTIPPAQAYGEAGRPPAIAPNETLVFVVELVGPVE